MSTILSFTRINAILFGDFAVYNLKTFNLAISFPIVYVAVRG